METTLIILLVILTIFLWFWAIFDITKSRFKDPIMKTVWLLAVLFFPVLGSIIYFQLRKMFVTNERRKFRPNFNRDGLKNN
ncbi:MAG: PLD nuclease N-terminal domain-containing protein [Cyclobacteriaceae bacterium]